MRFDAGQLPVHPCFTSSTLGVGPMVTPTQLSWRETNRRRGKEATNKKPEATKCQKRLRAREDPTRSVTSGVDQSAPRSNGSNSAVGDLESVYIRSVLHLTCRVFGLAVRDTNSRSTGLRCASSDVFDRKIDATSVHERWISKPREVFDNDAKAKLGPTENDAHAP